MERSTPNITVQRVAAAQVRPLRSIVLRPGLPATESTYPGDDAPTTFHVGAMLDDRIVSIASLYLEPRAQDPAGTWRLRGMATDPAMQRCGAGRVALEACLAHARVNEGVLAWCNARIGAIGFYERMGWQVVSDEFEIPGVGLHVVMELPLDP